MSGRRLFSVCIPAYNRARFLEALLESILSQDYPDLEVVICEDASPEREQISSVVGKFKQLYPRSITYHENERNLGYDANIRRLIEKASGRFCFFMGNDDLMCPGALTEVAGVLRRYYNVGLVLKSYAWFDDVPENINQTVRYFKGECQFAAGEQAIRVCFRRSGVISGYIVDRDAAHAAATSRFDGSLYYQMHLTASVLLNRNAVFTPKVLVLCRSGEPPDFGNSGSERGKYVPGRYTPQARLNMVGGALSIVRDLQATHGLDVVSEVMRDYANHFYAYIKDQLSIPVLEYWRLYRAFGRMGFDKYPIFHLYVLMGYLLGERRFDQLVRRVRNVLGSSPGFGRSTSG